MLINMLKLIFYPIFLYTLMAVPLILCTAYFTLSERKVMAAIQRRVGPNVVGL